MANKNNQDARPREFTLRALFLGSFLGIVFGVVTVYVALKVGLNFSASIPIAALAITAFKYLGRPSVLENNIVQTVGSAGESIAAGVVYTIPALLFLGYRLEIWRILCLALAGGVLGVLFMVPLRRYLIVKEHGNLIYPEGTACADILIAGERGGKWARQVFLGMGVGLAYKLLMSGLGLWRSVLEWSPKFYRGAVLSMEFSPELVGIGSLIGLRVARLVFAGSLMSSVVLIPMVMYFGEKLAVPLYPSMVPIGQMSAADIWSNYLRYVGAGAVITGGILLLFEAVPTIVDTVRGSYQQFRSWNRGENSLENRTEQDLAMPSVLLGSLAMLLFLYALLAWKINPQGTANLFSVCVVAVFGFFFVVVSSRITGLMGSSANPISGITIAVVMLTCLFFASAGWIGSTYEAVAVSIGAVVCIASSNAGTTAQDLKTGYLVGAVPRLQQLGLLVGVVTSVVWIGFTLTWINRAYRAPEPLDPAPIPASGRLVESGVGYQGKSYDVYWLSASPGLATGLYLVLPEDRLIRFREHPRIGSEQLPAPQAQVMAVLVGGLLNRRMEWRLLFIGLLIALVMELCGIKSLPFAVGLYLPLAATSTMMAGALIRHFSEPAPDSAAADAFDPGILYSSGLIAGGAICGIALALAASTGLSDTFDLGRRLGFGFLQSAPWAVVFFLGLCWMLWKENRRRA